MCLRFYRLKYVVIGFHNIRGRHNSTYCAAIFNYRKTVKFFGDHGRDRSSEHRFRSDGDWVGCHYLLYLFDLPFRNTTLASKNVAIGNDAKHRLFR